MIGSPGHLAPASCGAQHSTEWSEGGPEANLKQEHLGMSAGRQFSEDGDVLKHSVGLM